MHILYMHICLEFDIWVTTDTGDERSPIAGFDIMFYIKGIHSFIRVFPTVVCLFSFTCLLISIAFSLETSTPNLANNLIKNLVKNLAKKSGQKSGQKPGKTSGEGAGGGSKTSLEKMVVLRHIL